MSTLETLIFTTALAGVAGTGLGGLLGALFRRDSNQAISLLLSFASGVMLSVVCFDLIPEALETGLPMAVPLGALLFGVVIIFILNWIIDQKAGLHAIHAHAAHGREEAQSGLEKTPTAAGDDNKFSLFVAGIVMASAIAIHNIPEGMTLGAAYAGTNGTMGSSALTLAVLVGMHNIPVGMAISVPFIRGGMNKFCAVAITAAIGSVTVFGAMLGYWLGDISVFGLAVSLGFASGAMLYVIFDEILPQAFFMYRSKLPTFFTIFGIALGIVIVYL